MITVLDADGAHTENVSEFHSPDTCLETPNTMHFSKYIQLKLEDLFGKTL
jgi:hypothetical protein